LDHLHFLAWAWYFLFFQIFWNLLLLLFSFHIILNWLTQNFIPLLKTTNELLISWEYFWMLQSFHEQIFQLIFVIILTSISLNFFINLENMIFLENNYFFFSYLAFIFYLSISFNEFWAFFCINISWLVHKKITFY
jgi:hypothetical protein